MNEINKKITENLVPGVYSAIGQFFDPIIDNLKQQSERKYMCALSIGWNPVYDNAEKTVEVYIIHDFGDSEFYGENFNIQLKSFMRPEALFPSFDDLILAIHCDVEAAKVYLSKLI
jgi:FAD synthase